MGKSKPKFANQKEDEKLGLRRTSDRIKKKPLSPFSCLGKLDLSPDEKSREDDENNISNPSESAKASKGSTKKGRLKEPTKGKLPKGYRWRLIKSCLGIRRVVVNTVPAPSSPPPPEYPKTKLLPIEEEVEHQDAEIDSNDHFLFE